MLLEQVVTNFSDNWGYNLMYISIIIIAFMAAVFTGSVVPVICAMCVDFANAKLVYNLSKEQK